MSHNTILSAHQMPGLGLVVPVAHVNGVLAEKDELLKALELVASYPDIRKFVGSEICEVLDAAIAKARGQS